MPESIRDQQNNYTLRINEDGSINFGQERPRLITLISYNGTNPEYIGLAVPGVSSVASVWQIRKISYNGNSPISVLYAGSSASFNKAWSARTVYNYG